MIERYIDLLWYEKVYGKKFRNKTEAANYYLRKGEMNGDMPNPLFDPTYYKNCLGLGSEQSGLLHYLSEGIESGCRPSRYFDAEWYRWQNTDVAEFGCSVLHYLNVGGKEYRDPSPEVDMVALSRSHGQVGDGCVLTYMLSSEHINAHENTSVTISDVDLVNRQRNFLREIKPHLLKNQDAQVKGRNLLFVQCAEGSEFWSWFDHEADRDWDLFLNCYAGDFPQTQAAEYVCQQTGTKFTGMLKCWLNYGAIFDRYDYVFFIDDDLKFRFEDISLFFKLIKTYKLDLAQPSLMSGSQCVWRDFFNNQEKGMRRTNGVEIMMPALSLRARNLFLPYFLYSVSGFGLDLLMAKLAEHCGFSSGVVDDVVVCHEKNIDQAGGAYYEFLRSKEINSKYELWRMIKMLGLERCLYSLK